MIAEALTLAIILAILAVPILVYTYLIFPNFDGLAQDISWFKYDDQSQHYLYWAGFWIIIVLSVIGAIAVAIGGNNK